MDSPPLTLKREPMPLTALTHFLARSLAHLLSHSCSYSLTHSLTQSLTLSLTRSLSSPMCFSDAEGVSPAVEAVQAMCWTTRGRYCVYCVVYPSNILSTLILAGRGGGGSRRDHTATGAQIWRPGCFYTSNFRLIARLRVGATFARILWRFTAIFSGKG